MPYFGHEDARRLVAEVGGLGGQVLNGPMDMQQGTIAVLGDPRTRCSRSGPGTTTTSQERKAAAFRALHEGEPFVIPNPWDAGSAKVLAALGFQALATTSSGFAFTLGRLDGERHARRGRRARRGARPRRPTCPSRSTSRTATGPTPEDAAVAIDARGRGRRGRRLDRGLRPRRPALRRSSTRSSASPRPSRPHARCRFPFTLTARAENHIRGNPDLDDTIARLQAYERAGADVLYAPGLRDGDEIRAVCEAVAKPVNVLAQPRPVARARSSTPARSGSASAARSPGSAVEAMAAAATAIRDTGDLAPLGTSERIQGWLRA